MSHLTLFSPISPKRNPVTQRFRLWPSPSSSTASKEPLTRWNAYATSPSYTLYTRDNREAMKSLRIWRNTHVAKTNLHKIWAYQRSKGFSGFLNVTKRIFFLSFFRHVLFLFLLFFFLVWSHKPTEKGLEKLIFQGGNGRRTSFFFFFFKEVQLIIYFTHWN